MGRLGSGFNPVHCGAFDRCYNGGVFSHSGDKPPIFTIADRGTRQRYVIPAKAADESTIRLLLADRQQESLTVYTDGFRAYEPLEADDASDRKYVVHSDGEYADDEVHVNTCESQASQVRRVALASPRYLQRQVDTISQRFQLRPELFRKPGRDGLKHAVRATL